MKYDETILFIENDDNTRKIYSDFFRGIFATVIEASNGRSKKFVKTIVKPLLLYLAQISKKTLF